MQHHTQKIPKFDEVQTLQVLQQMFEPYQIYEVLCVMLH